MLCLLVVEVALLFFGVGGFGFEPSPETVGEEHLEDLPGGLGDEL
jgi:hypothetical protein